MGFVRIETQSPRRVVGVAAPDKYSRLLPVFISLYSARQKKLLRGKRASSMAEWKQKCDSEWKLAAKGVPLPDDVDWKTVYEKKPLERNLLKNPSPYGKLVTSQNTVLSKSAPLYLHYSVNPTAFQEFTVNDRKSQCKRAD